MSDIVAITTDGKAVSCDTIEQAASVATSRPLHEIAYEITRTWHKVNFAAAPYLHAMFELHTMRDKYGCDSADSIVRYFLSNAKAWRGDDARRIKAELNSML